MFDAPQVCGQVKGHGAAPYRSHAQGTHRCAEGGETRRAGGAGRGLGDQGSAGVVVGHRPGDRVVVALLRSPQEAGESLAAQHLQGAELGVALADVLHDVAVEVGVAPGLLELADLQPQVFPARRTAVRLDLDDAWRALDIRRGAPAAGVDRETACLALSGYDVIEAARSIARLPTISGITASRIRPWQVVDVEMAGR